MTATMLAKSPPHTPKPWLQRTLPFWLLLPAMAFLILIQVFPTLYSFYLSFTRVRGGVFSFVGLGNFQRLWASSDFYESLWRTLIFAGSYLVLTIGLGVALALLLNQKIRWRGFYVTLIFIPWVLSDVVSGTMWRWMFQQSYGIVQTALNPLLDGTSLLSNQTGAMVIVIVSSVWRTLAFTALLFLGALQTVPSEVLESAALDGASRWRSFWGIVFPLIRPTLLVSVLITSIRGINSLGLILATTAGGPGAATTTAAVLLYQEAWKFGDFGMAAAMAVFLFVINLALTFVYLRSIRTD
jgi:ABC-type sugar transport system permease subunit